MGIIQLVSPDGGSRAAVSTFGGRVLSWQSGGYERIFVPDALAFDGRAAPHGGIPVLYPQFGFFGSGRKHGVVRDREWMCGDSSPHSISLHIRLDKAGVLDALPHEVTLHVELSDTALAVHFAATNLGDQSAEFTCGLHAYFRVDDIDEVMLSGLEQTAYLDALDDLAMKPATGVPMVSPANIDRVYVGAPSRLVLSGKDSSLAIAQSGFGDTVIWNPGAEIARRFKDLADNEWRRFLCVEAAQIKPAVQLEPGGTWQGIQRLERLGD